MWQYNHYDELYHYGVIGMKWGRRKSGSSTSGIVESRRTSRLQKKVNHQKKVVESWKDASPIKDKSGNVIYSKKDIKDIHDAALNRLSKLEVKLVKSQMRDKINAGSSAVGRAFNKITGADKYQAEIEYDLNKRSKVNSAWRD